MKLWQFKAGVFFLEWVNAFATSLYFNYLFFFLKTNYGFTSYQNLLFCALNGFVYMIAAWFGGKFGQRRGYIFAMQLGFVLMAVMTLLQGFASSIQMHILFMVSWTVGMSFTWPNLEALAVEKESPSRLPRLVGVYNVTWASGTAIALFVGGAIQERFGWKAIFWIPATMHGVQLIIGGIMAPAWKRLQQEATIHPEGHTTHRQHPQAALFLKLAWLANPFAYIAINGAIPLIPEVAAKLSLSPKYAGYFCSIWFFSRMATFIVLALWPGWHYRFGWLISSYGGVILCFAGMLLIDSLWGVIMVQIAFGWCIGLIYYSSLYYSMDVGDEKGSHGGFHEAALGAGIFGGPAIGALSAYMFPERPAASVWGIALVLSVGLFGLAAMWSKRRTTRPI